MNDLNREVGEIHQKVCAGHDLLKDHIEDQQAYNTLLTTLSGTGPEAQCLRGIPAQSKPHNHRNTQP